MSDFSDSIINWHRQYGRHDLPWQNTKDPYRIWVSEIMLQQTQVSTVIPYYQRFMQRFPDVASLAQAEIDEVLHLWTGLGYYARGRNLHKAATQIVGVFSGEFPKNIDDMMSLAGIGRSTAGAILSFAFGLRHPILDGNVKRVLSRVFAVEGWYGKASVAEQLWQLADEHTPSKDVDVYTQAIMDFGATLCKRSKPICYECPLSINCIAFQTDRVQEFPGRKPKKKLPTKQCQMLVVVNQNNQVLLEQRPPSGIWGGLWSLPQFEMDVDLADIIHDKLGVNTQSFEELAMIKHTFSHYHLNIYPKMIMVDEADLQSNAVQEEASIWFDQHKEQKVGLPQPIKKILAKAITKAN